LLLQTRRIRLVGHVSDRAEFLDLIGSAAAYIHGHSVRGMNPSLVEAMYAKAPVVALDTPFSRETLGRTGLFFSSDSSGRLQVTDVLERLNEMSSSERTALREATAKRVLEEYEVESVVDAYEHLLGVASKAPSRQQLSMETRWS
jgi:glycosyltransferase involved in cell wall biosynthesis